MIDRPLVATLQRAPRPGAGPDDRCDFCRQEMAETHQYVVNLDTRGLLCACRACYLLFMHERAGQERYRAVPERYVAAPDFVLAHEQWDAFQIPMGLVFFFFNSSLNRTVACYPSPSGATESLPPLGAWPRLTRANPLLETLRPDVESLLVYKRSPRVRVPHRAHRRLLRASGPGAPTLDRLRGRGDGMGRDRGFLHPGARALRPGSGGGCPMSDLAVEAGLGLVRYLRMRAHRTRARGGRRQHRPQ